MSWYHIGRVGADIFSFTFVIPLNRDRSRDYFGVLSIQKTLSIFLKGDFE